MNLRALATDAAGELDVLGHDGNTLGVDGACEIGKRCYIGEEKEAKCKSRFPFSLSSLCEKVIHSFRC